MLLPVLAMLLFIALLMCVRGYAGAQEGCGVPRPASVRPEG
jgi:hypothetical protein